MDKADEISEVIEPFLRPNLQKVSASYTSQTIAKTQRTEGAPSSQNAAVYNEDGCGLFQILHVILTQSTKFAAVWGLFLMSFGIYNPGWRCLESQTWNCSTAGQNSSMDSGMRSKTRDTEIPLDGLSGLEYVNASQSCMYNQICPVQEWCKAVEFHPRANTIVTQFELICDKANIPSVIISIQMVGMLLGSLVAGQIGETFGRKTGLYSSTIILTLCSGFSVLSVSWEMYACFIFGAGFGCGGIMATCMVISTEILGSRWRAHIASIPVSSISLAIFAFIALASKDWKFLHLMTAAVSGLATLGGLWVPESLLWLHLHGTPKQTAKVIKKITSLNKTRTISKGIDTLSTKEAIGKTDTYEGKKATVLDLFSTTKVRNLIIKSLLIYLFIQVSYYTIGFGVQALPGDFYTNFLLSVFTEGVVVLLVGPASNSLGRKWACSLFATLSSVLCLAITVILYTRQVVSPLAVRVLAVLARAAVFSVVQAFNTMALELFPTSLRSLAFGLICCFSRLGLVGSPFLIPTSRQSLPLSFSCLAGMLIVSVVILFTLPETKNKRLPDIVTDIVGTENDSCVTECESVPV